MKAMILAAGVGSRLGALTTKIPKCLININGVPMLRLVAENLAKAGVRQVIINLHHHAEQVRDYASSALTDLFSQIEFSFESELLGTGGGLRAAAPFFSGQNNFLLVNADIYSSFDLARLNKPLIDDSSLLGSLAVMERFDSSYLEFDSAGNFCGWVKAGTTAESKFSAANKIRAFCGLQALSTRIFDYLSQQPEKSFSIIETYLRAYRSGEKIIAQEIGDHTWFDMGTPEQLERLREYKSSTSGLLGDDELG